MRRTLKILVAILAMLIALALYALAEARRDPVVRRATIALADWPAGALPVRAVLLSDVHLGNAATDRDRLTRVIGQVNALKPDIVLIAGDLITGHDAATAARVAPDLAAALSRLRAPLGPVAVLGNHDYGTDPVVVRRALMAARVTVLRNDVVRRGPLTIGGIDDFMTGHDDIPRTLAAMRRPGGAGIILTHTPDVARAVRDLQRIGAFGPQVFLAGHTHCGQIVLPGLGPIKTVIDARETYLCGLSRRGADRIVVSGGIGASVLPLRLGAPPDLWSITFGPTPRPRVSRSRS